MYLYDAAAVARLREHGILARSTEFAKLRGRPVGMPARLTAAQALGAHALGLLDGSSADQVFEAADWARAAAVVALVDRGYAVSDGVRFGADFSCYRGDPDGAHATHLVFVAELSPASGGYRFDGGGAQHAMCSRDLLGMGFAANEVRKRAYVAFCKADGEGPLAARAAGSPAACAARLRGLEVRFLELEYDRAATRQAVGAGELRPAPPERPASGEA